MKRLSGSTKRHRETQKLPTVKP